MKKILPLAAIHLILALVCASVSSAYWVWTPETKKFINPKYAVKDSPKEQFDWAMSFYEAKDYERAAFEFEKLARQYEYSEYAPRAQYYVGLCYADMNKYYLAFQNYQKAIDNFPHIDNIEEIIAREYSIGQMYAEKKNPKVLGTDIMTSYDRAIEIFQKVVDNAPFGNLADQAQFKLADTMKEAGRFEEATVAFQKLVEDYPKSELAEKARYEVAYCAYKASLKPAYDAEPTEKAIKAFERFAEDHRDAELFKEADETIRRLKDKAAEKSMMTAEFYERLKRYKSAAVYYKDVAARFPESSYAPLARKRIAEIESGNVEGDKKSWLPWAGGKKDEKEVSAGEAAAPAAATAEEKPKRWFPRFFGPKGGQAQPPQAVPAPAVPQAKPGGWFSFGAGQKAQPAALPGDRRTGWFPVGFGKKAVEPPANRAPRRDEMSHGAERPTAAVETVVEEEVTAEESAVPEPPAPAAVQEEIVTEEAVTEEAVTEEAAETVAAPVITPPQPVISTPVAPVVTNEPQTMKLYFEEVPATKEDEARIAAARASEAAAEEAAKGWTPFKFDKKLADSKEAADKAAIGAGDPGAKKARKGWFPVFGAKKEEEKPAAEKTKQGWVPFNFDKKK